MDHDHDHYFPVLECVHNHKWMLLYIASSQNQMSFSVFDKWFMVKLIEKKAGKSYSGKYFFYLGSVNQLNL